MVTFTIHRNPPERDADAERVALTDGLTPVADDEVVIGEGVALAVPPAGYLSRAVGTAIDVTVLGITMGLVSWLLVVVLAGWLERARGVEMAWVQAALVAYLAFWFLVVPVTIETLTGGRSLGKIIMGTRIVRDDGGAISFRHAFVRGLVAIPEFYLSGGSVAALVGLFTPKSKRVGDLLAGTYAQLERLPKAPPLDLALPPQLARWYPIADAARLPDRLARRIHDFFRQRDKLVPAARMRLAGQLARETKPYVHPIPDVDAETFLLGVSVVRRDREWRGLHGRSARLATTAPDLEHLPHGFPDRG